MSVSICYQVGHLIKGNIHADPPPTPTSHPSHNKIWGGGGNGGRYLYHFVQLAICFNLMSVQE